MYSSNSKIYLCIITLLYICIRCHLGPIVNKEKLWDDSTELSRSVVKLNKAVDCFHFREDKILKIKMMFNFNWSSHCLITLICEHSLFTYSDLWSMVYGLWFPETAPWEVSVHKRAHDSQTNRFSDAVTSTKKTTMDWQFWNCFSLWMVILLLT